MLRRRLKRAGDVILALTVHPLSRLMPRDPHCWAFGHQDGQFSGNPKYLFLWMAIHRPDLRVAWIGADRRMQLRLKALGYPAYARYSPKGIWAALRAGTHVYAHSPDDVSLYLSSGALLLNLWHGVGLKPTALGDAEGVVARHWKLRNHWFSRARYLSHVTMPDILATTSPFTQYHFSEQFRLPVERCPQLGYPRLDPQASPPLRAAVAEFEAGIVLNDRGYAEVLLYAPTFRDSGRDFLADALPDLARLERVLAVRNAVLYLKLHARTPSWAPAELPSRIRPWPKGAELYAHIDAVDVLITDYSSLFYDYLFVRSGATILYTFDREDYDSRDRGLLYPFDENVIGCPAYTFEDLCFAVASGAAHQPQLRLRAKAIRERFWSGSPVCASARIVQFIEAHRPARVPVHHFHADAEPAP